MNYFCCFFCSSHIVLINRKDEVYTKSKHLLPFVRLHPTTPNIARVRQSNPVGTQVLLAHFYALISGHKEWCFWKIFCLSLIQAEENLLHCSSCWHTFIKSSFPTMTFTTCSSMSFTSPRMCVKGIASRLVLHYIDAWGQLGYLKHDYVKKCAAGSRLGAFASNFLDKLFPFNTNWILVGFVDIPQPRSHPI